MADEGYISADIAKIAKFESDSADAIKEFDDIKTKFGDINTALLQQWKGGGADSYKVEADHILEKIGGIKDILDGINNSAVKDAKDSYLKLDAELGDYNRTPPPEPITKTGS
jgi:uncharacterized protein YukE